MIPENCFQITYKFYDYKEYPVSTLEPLIKQAGELIDVLVERPLLDFQREALLCLVADILGGKCNAQVKFPDSLLLKSINKGQFQIATSEFTKFCFLNGRVQTRLWGKRICESLLFSTGKLFV